MPPVFFPSSHLRNDRHKIKEEKKESKQNNQHQQKEEKEFGLFDRLQSLLVEVDLEDDSHSASDMNGAISDSDSDSDEDDIALFECSEDDDLSSFSQHDCEEADHTLSNSMSKQYQFQSFQPSSFIDLSDLSLHQRAFLQLRSLNLVDRSTLDYSSVCKKPPIIIEETPHDIGDIRDGDGKEKYEKTDSNVIEDTKKVTDSKKKVNSKGKSQKEKKKCAFYRKASSSFNIFETSSCEEKEEEKNPTKVTSSTSLCPTSLSSDKEPTTTLNDSPLTETIHSLQKDLSEVNHKNNSTLAKLHYSAKIHEENILYDRIQEQKLITLVEQEKKPRRR